MIGNAKFSPDKSRRYQLTREQLLGDGWVCWVMRNPSQASDVKNDPTVSVISKISFGLGYKGLVVCNLSSEIATIPAPLKVAPEDDRWIIESVCDARVKCVVAAWGSTKQHDAIRANYVVSRLLPRPLFCMGITGDGSPWHPLRKKFVGLVEYLGVENYYG